MSLQPAGLNAPDANTISALVNMNSAIGASEERVQRSNDEVISKLSKALEQSETNNKLLKERNTQLAGRLETLEKNVNDLQATRHAETRASDVRISALNEKVEALITQLMTLERNYAVHTHQHNFCCPHRGNCSGTMDKTSTPIDNNNKTPTRGPIINAG